MPAGGTSGTPDTGGIAGGGAEAKGGACQLGDGGAGLGAAAAGDHDGTGAPDAGAAGGGGL